ncbi:Elongation of very long chain fatty acids protein 6 [Halotydeus destructor]|nr:Elongation of very long chain fatty acids protein 6 [Halotydeus destructor]
MTSTMSSTMSSSQVDRIPLLPDYSYVFDFEKNFEYEQFDKWLHSNWTLCFPIACTYVAAIFGIKHLMVDRKPLGLRWPLLVWNLSLSVFSMFGAVRMIPEVVHVLTNFGLNHAICVEHQKDGVFGFWVVAMFFSKFIELGDTVFIVLRKQPLIFLHWYHHVTVLLSVCHNSLSPLSTGRWYMSINFAIHGVMYAYYAGRAAGLRFPKFIPLTITTAQISQMLVAIFVSSYAWTEQNGGRQCQVDRTTLVIAYICYGTYFVLFANFFINAYLSQKVTTKCKSRDQRLTLERNYVEQEMKKGI